MIDSIRHSDMKLSGVLVYFGIFSGLAASAISFLMSLFVSFLEIQDGGCACGLIHRHL